MNLTFLYLYIGLFIIIVLLFKIVNKKDNPFRKISFWVVQFVAALLLSILLAYMVLRALGGGDKNKEVVCNPKMYHRKLLVKSL
jgi:hypothetical protein